MIRENVVLAPLTTFGIGGAARFFVEVRSLDDLRAALAFARQKTVPYFILGGGANLLVDDEGFPGLVVKLELGGITLRETTNGVLLTAAAGELWDAVVQYAIENGVWGIENLSGIPGTLGGAVVGNIGAYGQALSTVIHGVEVFECATGEIKTLTPAECAFEYRDSAFKHTKALIVLGATLSLSQTPAPNLSYRDLANAFPAAMPTLAEIRAAILTIRSGKFPDLGREGSAGSFFKNPIVSKGEAQRLQQRYPQMPVFSMPETSGIKVPLAWILDHALALKGFAIGGARLYEKQPLVITAARGARAEDIEALAREVERRVRETVGIELEREVIHMQPHFS